MAKEHEELLEAFQHPPNVFNSFVLSAQNEALLRAQQAENRAQQAEDKLCRMERRAQQAEWRL